MRLIRQKVDALAVLQLYKFSDARLLTGVSLNYRPRPQAVTKPRSSAERPTGQLQQPQEMRRRYG